MRKYIFVTGGVCSSLGKGLAAASIASLLEEHNYRICMIKIDPYLNVDAGTMNPYQHGEVYVTDDGAETDLDLGNYERFTKSIIGKENSITTGQVYQTVIRKEREGRFLGHTVQVIPHITDEIKHRIEFCSDKSKAHVVVIEVGGTVGDIESLPFLEALRQIELEVGKDNVLSVHLVLLPTLANHELKTKPAQHAVKLLRESGIHPDILLCRSQLPVQSALLDKIAMLTSVDTKAVISAHDVKDTLYEIPLNFHKQFLDHIVLEKLSLEIKKNINLQFWKHFTKVFRDKKNVVRIALLGKYVGQSDTYRSVEEALLHAAIVNDHSLQVISINAEDIYSDPQHYLKDVDGVLAPGGFGERGIEGLIQGIQYVREQDIPFLGICLGMQSMVIEYARNVLGMDGAHSTEFDANTDYPVVSLLEEQVGQKIYGGTMRLGLWKAHLLPGSKLEAIYGKKEITERHRHRYEFSDAYREKLHSQGLVVSAETEDVQLVEVVEWKYNTWGVGVQFHPEFLSRPRAPHPLFVDFIRAAINK